jgi:peroxiredoxin
MKKVLLIAAVCGCVLGGCNTSNFTVTGTIEGVSGGNACLVAFDETRGTVDTLAIAPVTNGKFNLKGKLDEVRLVFIAVADNSFRFFLEQKDFTITITKAVEGDGNRGDFHADIKGGEVQRVAELFDAIQQEADLRIEGLREAAYATEDSLVRDSLHQVFFAYREDVEAREDELAKANPDAYATAFFIYYYRATNAGDVDELRKTYNILGEKGKATKYGKLIEERIRQMEHTSVGQIAPDFTLVTPQGDSISLHGIEAKVKLIDFWASWCGPCRAENPNVVAAYAEYHPKGLEIIGVSLDTERDSWLRAISDDQLTWKHGFDPTGGTAQTYGVTGIPHTLLLDSGNKIISKNLRGDALKTKLAELLD